MNSKDRFLIAMQGGKPDRVPVTPDISNYIPCKLTGLPFWDIYFFNQKPLWRAYLEACDYFGIDPWVASGTGVPFTYEEQDKQVTTEDSYVEKDDGYLRKTAIRTSVGELTSASLCLRHDPPSPLEKPIKDIEKDLPVFRSLQQTPLGINTEVMDEIRTECENRQCAFGLCIGYPGFQSWMNVIEDGLMQLSCLEMDTPAILEEWAEADMVRGTKMVELLLDYGVDYILWGGSGTITLSSPDLARKYAIPSLKKWSRMAKDAGVPTLLHSCGKSRVLVDMLVEETDVDCINPLEIAPMGDIDIEELMTARGGQISLMGNLHTTDLMLNGTPEQVREESKRLIDIAGKDGGFILSTGDQCGYGTPDENLLAMVEVAKQATY